MVERTGIKTAKINENITKLKIFSQKVILFDESTHTQVKSNQHTRVVTDWQGEMQTISQISEQLSYLKTPWRHQLEAIERARTSLHQALFWEPGTGKTAAIVGIVRLLDLLHGDCLRWLIICPMSVTRVWLREFEAHAGLAYAQSCVIVEGTGAKRVKTLQAKTRTIFITNFETVNSDAVYARLQFEKYDGLVIDESQRCKNPKAKSTKRIITLADNIKRKFVLSGTPVTNKPQDIWAQFRILSPDIFGRNYWAWLYGNFYDKNKGNPYLSFPDWQPQPGTEHQIAEIIGETASIVKKSDVLDLPPLVIKTIPVRLTPELRRIYNDLYQDFMAVLGNGEIIVTSIIVTKMLRLQQVCNGILPVFGQTEYRRAETNKLGALHEQLEVILSSGHQCIVWCNFIDSIKDIQNVCFKLETEHSLIVGGQHPSFRQQQIDLFQGGRARVMIANPAAGGVGINLQAAAYSIYYSRDFNLEKDIQSQARNYRGGSEIHEKITRINLVTEDTIESDIAEALDRKQKLGEMLLSLRRNARKH